MKRYSFPAIILLCISIAWVGNSFAQRILSIGTNPTGSSYHIIGVGISTIVEKYTPIRIKVVPYDAAHAWMPLMPKGQIDLGVASNWNAQKGYLGESMYKDLSKGKGFPVRLVFISVPNMIGAIVAGSSSIHSIADLKGKRVAGPIPNVAMQLQTECILANGGLKWSDVKPAPAKSPPEGVKLIIEGRADAAMVALGTPVIEELQAKKGARFLSLDPSPQAVERTKSVYPGYPVKVLPGPAKTGIERETYLWAFDNYIVARAELEDDVVYQLTKAVFEHCDELSAFHVGLKDLKPSMFVSLEALIPYHPGAVKLYKEKGLWTKEMEALQKRLLSVKKD